MNLHAVHARNPRNKHALNFWKFFFDARKKFGVVLLIWPFNTVKSRWSFGIAQLSSSKVPFATTPTISSYCSLVCMLSLKSGSNLLLVMLVNNQPIVGTIALFTTPLCAHLQNFAGFRPHSSEMTMQIIPLVGDAKRGENWFDSIRYSDIRHDTHPLYPNKYIMRHEGARSGISCDTRTLLQWHQTKTGDRHAAHVLSNSKNKTILIHNCCCFVSMDMHPYIAKI